MPLFDDEWHAPPQNPRKNRLARWFAIVVGIGLTVWLLWPATSRVRDATGRVKSTSFLKQIGLAMQNYDSAKGRLPPQAICEKDGKKLLSWRVAILPYIEQGALYAKFKLDEPWDSPHNLALVPEMPVTLCTPSADRKQGLSRFKVFTGPGTIFEMEDSDEGWRNKWSIATLTKSQRGTSNLVFCVESDDPVVWTKPEDWDYDPMQPFPTMKPVYPNLFMALMGDGSVRSVRLNMPVTAWRASVEPDSPSKETLDQ
jgi:hypothetical protein